MESLNDKIAQAKTAKFIVALEQKQITFVQKVIITLLGALCVLLLGVVDFFESHYLSLMIFYLIPISFVTWRAGKLAGYLILGVSVIIWLSDDILASSSYLRPTVPYWDLALKIVFCSFYINILCSLKRALDTEKKYARIDYLTETANLRYFFDIANMEIKRARRYSQPLTLAYLDLDNFKYVNDHFGHHTGDKLLKYVASTIKQSLRGSDVIARVGGDEFAILLVQTNQEQALKALERMKQNISNLMSRYRWPVTFSMGVITCSGSVCSFDTLLTKADDLMYTAKRSGKNMIKQTILDTQSGDDTCPVKDV